MSELIPIKRVHLHNTIFVGGTNLGTKLDPAEGNRRNMKIHYNREQQELHVHWNDEMAIIPITNVSAMIPCDEKKFDPPKAVELPKERSSAQVSTPQSHVFAGQGHGKTNK